MHKGTFFVSGSSSTHVLGSSLNNHSSSSSSSSSSSRTNEGGTSSLVDQYDLKHGDGAESKQGRLFKLKQRQNERVARFDLSSEEYLEQSAVALYLKDATNLMLASRHPNPMQYLSAYFTQVQLGQHVVRREFAYVRMTTWNRRSFVHHVRTALDSLQSYEDSSAISLQDFHQLLCTLCTDLPLEFVQDMVEWFCHEAGEDGTPILSLTQYLAYFKVYFVYQEFLVYAKRLFESTGHGSTLTSRSTINRNVFVTALMQLSVQREQFTEGTAPKPAYIEHLAGLLEEQAAKRVNTNAVTFEGFCTAITGDELMHELLLGDLQRMHVKNFGLKRAQERRKFADRLQAENDRKTGAGGKKKKKKKKGG